MKKAPSSFHINIHFIYKEKVSPWKAQKLTWDKFTMCINSKCSCIINTYINTLN